MRAVRVLVILCLAAVADHAEAVDPVQLEDATLEQLGEALRSGALSSVELSVLYFNRIQAYDRRGPKLNAVPVINPRWLEEAARADALRARGVELGPLQGLSVLVKDSYNVAGLPTSVGMATWTNLMPPEDAFIVARLRQAGAVILGKTNLDTFAASDEGVSQAFGPIASPYGVKRVGGSSGGSAVAVAASFATVAFGGDTAGSLRMPASRNGIVAIRPTLGLISTRGTAPGDPLFDAIGPMTRSVRDLALVMDAVVQEDPVNPLRAHLPAFTTQRPESYRSRATPSLRGMTFAVPRRLTSPKSAPPKLLTPGKPVLDAFADVRRKLERAGAKVVDVDVPVDAILDDTWYYDQDVSQAGEEARAIYAARTGLANIHAFAHEWEHFCRGWCGDPATRLLDVAALFDYPEFMQAFVALRDAKTLPLSAAPIREALANSAQIAEKHRAWLAAEGFDALLFPATSDADSDTRFGLNYLSDLGLPGLFVPAALIEGRQPIGVALVGTRFAEKRLIEIGVAVEDALHARVIPPLTPSLESAQLQIDRDAIRPADRKDKSPPTIVIDAAGRAGTVVDASAVREMRAYAEGRRLTLARDGERWSLSGVPADADVLIFAKDAKGNAAAAIHSGAR